MNRLSLLASSAIALVDQAGVPIPPTPKPPQIIDIRMLPVIGSSGGLPELPPGVEARMCEVDAHGDGPEIVLWHPEHEVAVWCPLADLDQLPTAVRAMEKALPRPARKQNARGQRNGR